MAGVDRVKEAEQAFGRACQLSPVSIRTHPPSSTCKIEMTRVLPVMKEILGLVAARPEVI
eukprot:COSAG06_NODE_10740_length_1625_cov_1.465619_2_plen_60_part_00